MSEGDATQRLRKLGVNSGEHHWRNLLGEAIASIGDRQDAVERILTDTRLKLEHQLTRVEVSKIAADANKPVEEKLNILTKLVFGVLAVIVLAVAGDVIAWTHK